MDLTLFCALVVAASPPILLAVLGETLTERAGVINLSLDGSILLAAMTAFVTARATGSVAAGFAAAAAVGAAVAGMIAFASLSLKQGMVATGFVLALLCRDLAYVLGNAHTHLPGPQVAPLALPGAASIPFLGPVLFNHNPVVYASLLLPLAAWWFLYRTRPGLVLRGLGERPAAAHARGIAVTRRQYLYALAGGALVGVAGASLSLLVKPGWARPYGVEGIGWIALAIVIFGNWHPLRAAAGAFFFVMLQTSASVLQAALPQVPTQIFPTLPFPVMILMLLMVNAGESDGMRRLLAALPSPLSRLATRTLATLKAAPPAALGKVAER